MDGYTDTMQVYLRLVRESTATHSPQCVRYISHQSVHFYPPAMGSHTEFSADYVFEATESLGSICDYVSLDPGKVNCVLSLGNSDLLNGSQGLIANYIGKIVAFNRKISIGCVGFTDGKVTNYLSEAYMTVSSLEEVGKLTRDMSQCKQRRELLVFSVFDELAGCTQFIEATHTSTLLNQLLGTLTNANPPSFPLNHLLFDVIYRSICYQSRVIAIGNVGNRGDTAWILSVTACLMENRGRCRTFLISLWRIEVETLEKQGENMIKRGSDRENRHKQAILPLQQELNALNQALKAPKYPQNEQNIPLQRLEREVNGLKHLHLQREAAINALKCRIKELESELETRNNGISTQFLDFMGSFDERIEKLSRENEELRRKNGVLEVNVSALKVLLAPKARAEAWTQIFARPLALYFPLPISLPCTQREVDTLRTVASEEDQCKALYNLLTETWRYTDTALRRLKQAFDQMQAALQLAICDRDLKEAEIEYRISKASTTPDPLLDLDRQAAVFQQTNTALTALQRKLAEKEEYLLRKKQKFASYAHALKTRYKLKQKEAKEGTGELQQLKEEVEEQQEEREMELRREQRDRRELQERVAALQEAIESLGQ